MSKELIYKSWNDISISLYREIVEILGDESISSVERNIALLALLMGLDESDVYNMSVPEVSELLTKMDWINSFKFNENWKSKKITLNGKDFNIEPDLTKFTIAQYVDFQTYWAKKDNNKYLANLLSCFIIPKGCKYNEGYNILEVTQCIEDNLPITTANSILFFFLKESVSLIKALQISLDWKLKKMKTKKNKDKIQEAQQKMNLMWQAVFNGLV